MYVCVLIVLHIWQVPNMKTSIKYVQDYLQPPPVHYQSLKQMKNLTIIK